MGTEHKKEETAQETEERLRQQSILDQDVIMGWETPDSRHHERGPLWYVAALAAGILMVLYAIFTQAWTLAVVVAMLAAVIFLFSQEAPGNIMIVITKLGIHVNKKFYPYKNIRQFWILTEPGYTALCFQTKGKLSQNIQLNLEKQNVNMVREILGTEITEVAREEQFFDMMARKLKL